MKVTAIYSTKLTVIKNHVKEFSEVIHGPDRFDHWHYAQSVHAAHVQATAATAGAEKVKERIAMMRQKLAEAKPDVLVCIGNDHLHQFFMDNMPAFMIGKMGQYDGTFYDEERSSACRNANFQATSTFPTRLWKALLTVVWISPIRTN